MSGDGLIARVPSAKVALSTASTYPESTAAAFEIASRLGYDGVEVMVWTDPVSQDINALRRLSDYHQIPILAIHSPCLIITQRVWGTDPWGKLQKAQKAAELLGASTVVVHPRKGAAASTSDGKSAIFWGPFVKEPKISTGAGDHFNAGFVVGRLLGLGVAHSLQLAVAASGFYVRHAVSPNREQLVRFLQTL